MAKRQARTPRPVETYRWWRRNNSDLNRDRKNWYGVEPDRYAEQPLLVGRLSERGERSYREMNPRAY